MKVLIKGEEWDFAAAVQTRAAIEGSYVLGALGLAGESGEVVELVKKMEFHGVECTREKRLKELGDVLWYVTYLASLDNASLEEVAQMNTDKLVARYPDGFVQGGGIREGAGAA